MIRSHASGYLTCPGFRRSLLIFPRTDGGSPTLLSPNRPCGGAELTEASASNSLFLPCRLSHLSGLPTVNELRSLTLRRASLGGCIWFRRRVGRRSRC